MQSADHITLHQAAVFVTHLYFAIFLFFSFIAFTRLVRLWVVSKKGWDIKKIIHCMIPVGLLVRAAWFAILLERYYTDDHLLLLIAPLPEQTASSIVVGSLPGYWSISDYLLVCLFWVYLSQSSGYAQTSRAIHKIRNIYLAVNITMYSVWIALMVLIVICDCSSLAHTIEASFATALNLVMGIMFSVTGPRLYAKMRSSFNSHNPKQTLMQRRVGLLSIVCCVSFFLRSLVLGLSFFVFTTSISIFVATCCYLLLLESIPEMLILVVMGTKNKRDPGLSSDIPNEKTPIIS